MKCLVTGGLGFMGSHLTDYLVNEGHEVVALDNLSGGYMDNLNPKAEFVPCDLRCAWEIKKVVTKKKPEVIYHLAAHAAEGQSVFTPRYTAEVNYVGMINLLTAMINEGVETIVFTSSMAVYGRQQPPLAEDMPRKPVDPYGLSKAACEQLLEIYQKVYGYNYVIIRPHNLYGERQNIFDPYRNAVSIFVNRVLWQGKPPIVYGDGMQTRQFSYVGDCTPPIARSAWTKEAYGEIINVGSSEVTELKELAHIVLEACGRTDLTPEYADWRPTEVKHAWVSNEKAERILGLKAETSLRDGVGRLVKWAGTVKPQPFKYWDSSQFEIKKKIPKVWSEQKL